MKHTFTLLFILLLSGLAHAQLQKGDWLIALDRDGGLVPPYSADLGGLSVQKDPFTDDTRAGLDFGVTYGYAVIDRLVVGASVDAGVSFLDGLSGSYRLDPFARYYFLNRPDLGAFGQVGTQISSYGYNDTHSAFHELELKAGVQIPIASGLLLTPTVEYTARAGRNVLAVGAGLELLLQPGTEGEQPTGDFGKGTLTLGAQSASFARRRRVLQGGFSVGGQYFLTDRLAAGVQLGFGYLRIDVGNFPTTVRDTYGGVSVDIGASARYYLSPPKRLVWFVDGGAGYTHSWSTNNVSLDTRRSSNTYLSAGGGAQYFIRDNVALEATPQFRYNLTDDELNPRTSLGINFGFRVML